MTQKQNHKDNNPAYSIVLVYSTGHAIHAEKLIKDAGFNCRLVPIPRHLSSDCGVSVKIEQKDKEDVLKVLKKYNFEFDNLHDL